MFLNTLYKNHNILNGGQLNNLSSCFKKHLSRELSLGLERTASNSWERCKKSVPKTATCFPVSLFFRSSFPELSLRDLFNACVLLYLSSVFLDRKSFSILFNKGVVFQHFRSHARRLWCYHKIIVWVSLCPGTTSCVQTFEQVALDQRKIAAFSKQGVKYLQNWEAVFIIINTKIVSQFLANLS